MCSVPGGNGESVHAVALRLSALLRRLAAEQPRDTPRVLLLVAHGDTLQILQALCKAPGELATHRRFFSMETGELRRVC